MISARDAFEHAVHSSFGVFYPTNYIVAIFSTLRLAIEAAAELELNGYKNEMLVLKGDEFIDFSNEIHAHASLWSQIASRISRAIGSEELLLDLDLRYARSGGAFLAIHSATGRNTRQICEMLQSLGPVSLHHYSKFAVDRIV